MRLFLTNANLTALPYVFRSNTHFHLISNHLCSFQCNILIVVFNCIKQYEILLLCLLLVSTTMPSGMSLIRSLRNICKTYV